MRPALLPAPRRCCSEVCLGVLALLDRLAGRSLTVAALSLSLSLSPRARLGRLSAARRSPLAAPTTCLVSALSRRPRARSPRASAHLVCVCLCSRRPGLVRSPLLLRAPCLPCASRRRPLAALAAKALRRPAGLAARSPAAPRWRRLAFPPSLGRRVARPPSARRAPPRAFAFAHPRRPLPDQRRKGSRAPGLGLSGRLLPRPSQSVLVRRLVLGSLPSVLLRRVLRLVGRTPRTLPRLASRLLLGRSAASCRGRTPTPSAW